MKEYGVHIVKWNDLKCICSSELYAIYANLSEMLMVRVRDVTKLEGQVHFLLTSAFVHVPFSKIDFQKFSFRKTRGQIVDTFDLRPATKAR